MRRKKFADNSIKDPKEYLKSLQTAYNSWPECRRDHREPEKLLKEIEKLTLKINEKT